MSWVTLRFSATVTPPVALLLAGFGAAFAAGVDGVAALQSCDALGWAGVGGVAALGCAASGCGDFTDIGGWSASGGVAGSAKVTRAGVSVGSGLQLGRLRAEALACKVPGSCFSDFSVGTLPVVVVHVTSDSAGASCNVAVASLGAVLEPVDSLGSSSNRWGAVSGACLGTAGGCSAGAAGVGAAAFGCGGDFKDMLVRCFNRKIGCLAKSS